MPGASILDKFKVFATLSAAVSRPRRSGNPKIKLKIKKVKFLKVFIELSLFRFEELSVLTYIKSTWQLVFSI